MSSIRGYSWAKKVCLTVGCTFAALIGKWCGKCKEKIPLFIRNDSEFQNNVISWSSSQVELFKYENKEYVEHHRSRLRIQLRIDGYFCG